MDDLIVAGAVDLIEQANLEVIFPNVAAAGLNRSVNAMLRRRAVKARDIAILEMKKGSRDKLDVADPDEFAAILYRYMRAATEGQATINLRLMAQVMRGHAINPSLFASDFLAYADLISSLRREEVVFLATMLRLTHAGSQIPKTDDSGEQYDLEQSVEIELRRSLPGTEFFPNRESVSACELAIQRTGLLRHVTSTWC